jgi:hypothetical protein
MRTRNTTLTQQLFGATTVDDSGNERQAARCSLSQQGRGVYDGPCEIRVATREHSQMRPLAGGDGPAPGSASSPFSPGQMIDHARGAAHASTSLQPPPPGNSHQPARCRLRDGPRNSSAGRSDWRRSAKSARGLRPSTLLLPRTGTNARTRMAPKLRHKKGAKISVQR